MPTSPEQVLIAHGAEQMMAALKAVGLLYYDIPTQAVIGKITVPIEILDRELAIRGIK